VLERAGLIVVGLSLLINAFAFERVAQPQMPHFAGVEVMLALRELRDVARHPWGLACGSAGRSCIALRGSHTIG
jgi:hypothetical protein